MTLDTGMGRGALVALMALLGVLWMAGAGLNDMGFFSSDKRDLQRLLGEPGAALVEGAEIATWQPDPDHKPRAYYALRSVDEAGLRRMAGPLGLTLEPIPAVELAVWKLPAGVALQGWAAAAMAPGSGLQAQGGVPGANLWLRWQGGRLFVVVMRAT